MRAVLVDAPLKHADDLLQCDQPTSKSAIARELILDTLEEAPDLKYESNALDALTARNRPGSPPEPPKTFRKKLGGRRG